MAKQDKLREKVKTCLSHDDGGFFKGYTIYEPRLDELMALIQAELAAERNRLLDKFSELLLSHPGDDFGCLLEIENFIDAERKQP